MEVWTYVITVDKGAAPNFQSPACTLTLCKPRIRKHAEVGQLILAFNGKRLNSSEPHSVCWAGIVSEVIRLEDYWADARFSDKKPGRQRGQHQLPDNIYRPSRGGGFDQVTNDTHLPKDKPRDLSGQNALVLKRSWYFGPTGAILPTEFGLRMIGGRRGQRRSRLDRSSWIKLIRWLEKNCPASKPLRLRSGAVAC